jgi:hypothetical protein
LEGLSSGGSSGAIVLIDSATVRDRDIVSPVSGLGNSKIIYVFGTAVGDVDISGRILLGPSGRATNGISKIKDYFESKRVFKSRGGVNLSVPGAAYKIQLIGFALGAADPFFNIQQFVISGIIADPLS